jgi:hypothetical protein
MEYRIEERAGRSPVEYRIVGRASRGLFCSSLSDQFGEDLVSKGMCISPCRDTFSVEDRIEDRAEDICDTTKWKDELKLVKVEAVPGVTVTK